MIPETAIQAACHAYRHPNRMVTNTSDGRHRDCIEAALEAALPHIRKQIAADLRAKGNTYPTHSERRGAWHSAARIAEEGTTK